MLSILKNFFDGIKGYLDAISVATVLATLTAWLPPLAAAVSIVWGVIRIYETRTMQGWLQKRKKCQMCLDLQTRSAEE